MSALLALLAMNGCRGATGSPTPQALDVGSGPLVDRIHAVVVQADEPGGRLKGLEELRRLEPSAASSAQARQVLALELMRLEAEVGNHQAALRYADQVYPAEETPAVGDLTGYVPANARNALASAAESARVVMINEAHHVPQHRAFVWMLLHDLRERGYTHFAPETLVDPAHELFRRGYPSGISGPYASETVYGDLIRAAVNLGYQLVPYDAVDEPTNAERERRQAANLVRGVFQDSPDAKLVVLAGYGHINEQPFASGRRPMAVHFRELTGIDPLTVDQTVMTERADPQLEHPLYRSWADRSLAAEPVLFRSLPQGTFWSAEPGARDVTVFHPRTVTEWGRPTWLRLGGARVPYLLDERICSGAPRCLVEAFHLGEGADAVPADRLEVVAVQGPHALLLPRGPFRVRVEDHTGAPMSELRIEVH